MRRFHAATNLVTFVALAAMTAESVGQRVAFPTPTTMPPPAVGTPAFTSPQPIGTVAPAPFPPPTVQPQPFPPFDPYAQPAQFISPAPPPAAVPYTAAPPPAPAIGFPSIVNVGGGFYASFEATILEPNVGDFNATVDFMPPIVAVDYNSNWGFEFSPRVIAGYKGPGGLGIRGRWFYFNHGSNGQASITVTPPGPPPFSLAIPTNLKINSIDLEGTQDGQFNSWDFQIAGGIRYATIDYQLRTTIPTMPDPIQVSALSEFSGVGPTVAVAGRRPLMSVDGLAFLVNLRVAFLFGDTDVTFSLIDPPPPVNITTSTKDLIQVWETQIGVEYSREFQYGVRAFAGAFLEAQVWEWDEGFGIGGGDLGFFGPTVAVGIAR